MGIESTVHVVKFLDAELELTDKVGSSDLNNPEIKDKLTTLFSYHVKLNITAGESSVFAPATFITINY